MSYILDALRKSDQQRQRGTAPTLHSAQMMQEFKRPLFLVYGVLGAVLIGVGMAIGWLRPWQLDQPATESIAAKPLELDSRGNAAPLPTSSVVMPAAPASALVNTQLHRTSRSTDAAASAEAPMPPSGMPGNSTAGQEPHVLNVSELPPAIQQEIPAMSISVHAYSPLPKDRMVGINDRLLREGGVLPPGLILEQITPEGMVFNYKGYRFKRGLGAAESR